MRTMIKFSKSGKYTEAAEIVNELQEDDAWYGGE